MEIQRLEVVTDEAVIEELWQFYQDAFADLNELTPIAQTWPRDCFDKWMVNERVIVIIIRINGEVAAMGVVTDDISIEPLLSPSYFAKHHPDGAWYFPVIAVGTEYRTSVKVARKMIEQMMIEIPENVGAPCYMFHSTEHNSKLPALITRFCKGRVTATPLGSESCLLLMWDE